MKTHDLLRTSRLLPLFLLPLFSTTIAAQLVDPKERIKEIAEEVAEEMQEIDRMLLQNRGKRGANSRPSSGSGAGLDGASSGIKRNAKKLDELLDQSQASQAKVIENIDELIRELQRMSEQNQQKSQQQGQEQKDQQQQSKPQQGQGQRRQSSSPEMVNQRRQQQQQQQGKNKPADQQRKEDNTASERTPGKNQKGPGRPKGETEKVKRAADLQRWGVLQQYEEFMKNRGGSPEVPESYRRYLEEILKRGNKRKR